MRYTEAKAFEDQKMKIRLINKRIKALLLAALMICSAILFCSCSKFKESNAELEGLGRAFIDSIIADDYDTAYSYVSEVSDEETFGELYAKVREMLGGETEYTLKLTGWNGKVSNGVSTHTTVYTMTMESGKSFEVTFATAKGTNGLSSFYIAPVTASRTSGVVSVIIKVLVGALSIAVIVFTVLMIVDCARRKIKLKALWIVVILLGIRLGMSLNGSNLALNGFIGLMVSMSKVSIVQGGFSVRLLIPLGAIVYFFVRKKLRAPEIKVNPTVEEPKEQDENNNEQQ